MCDACKHAYAVDWRRPSRIAKNDWLFESCGVDKRMLETTRREALSEQTAWMRSDQCFHILKHLAAEAKGTPWRFYVDAANSPTAVNDKPLESIQWRKREKWRYCMENFNYRLFCFLKGWFLFKQTFYSNLNFFFIHLFLYKSPIKIVLESLWWLSWIDFVVTLVPDLQSQICETRRYDY